MENIIKTDTNITNAPKKDYCAPMHTTEHILNQTMIRLFDCGRCFSAHVEAKKSKCDYHFSRALTDADIANIEEKVNEVILSNLEVKAEYFSNINPSGNLKAIYCSSGLSYFDPIYEDDELVGTQYLSIASEDGIGECIMTCDNDDNGTYTVSEGVLTLDITMIPQVAQYTIRNLNVEDEWYISMGVDSPINMYAGGSITPTGVDLNLIVGSYYAYPYQNGNDISIFAAPWQSNADIPSDLWNSLPGSLKTDEFYCTETSYAFRVEDDVNWFERTIGYKEVAIGGAVIMDGPFTEGAESKWKK